MSWINRILNVLRPTRLRPDLERELNFHLMEREEELRSGGFSHAEAARESRMRFGSLTTHLERTHDMNINTFLDACVRNLRLAVRSLAKAPLFTATVVLTLAVGIGANSSVFSLIDAVLLRPLPFPGGERLVQVAQIDQKRSASFVAPVRLQEWNRLNTAFEGITGAYVEDAAELSGELPERYRRAFVAPRFLKVLGVGPALGRDFTQQEQTFGGPAAVIISDGMWRRRFNADPNVIGRTLLLGRNAVPIVAVMPAGFAFPSRDVDIWASSPPDAPYARARTLTWFSCVGRVKPGVSLGQSRENLKAVQAGLAREFPEPDANLSTSVTPLLESTVGGARNSLWLLFGSVSLLLLLTCANVAALLLARASSRQHEVAVRFSVGGSKFAVAAQLLTEVFVLALAGSALGLLLAAGAASILRVLAKDIPRLDEIAVDWRIAAYTLLCAVATTLLCGLMPVLLATRHRLAGSLNLAGRSQIRGQNGVHLLLTGAQVALAVTLLAGAGLLLRSFHELGRVSPGFDPNGILTFHLSSSWSETADRPAVGQRLNRILDGLRSVPGVTSVASTITLPGIQTQYQVEFVPVGGTTDQNRKILAQSRFVTSGYFETLRIPILEGEVCRDGPGLSHLMVNKAFVQAYMPEGQVIGRRLQQAGTAFVGVGEIRGISGSARESGVDREPEPTVYGCGMAMQPSSYFAVRTAGDPAALANTIRAKLHELEPRRPVYGLMPLSDQISDSYAQNRLRTILVVFFALTAVSLACMGLYGTLSYLVLLRRKEIGVRIALGAMRGQIVRQFLGQGLWVAILGCVAGLGFSIANSKVLAGMLYGVTPSDPLTLAGVVAMVLAVSAIASFVPGLRAARIEPLRALRDE